MKYFILIFFSLNSPTAYANECARLFESKKAITEKEIDVVIHELRSLLEQIHSPDTHKTMMARIFFKTKHAELAQYFSTKEIKNRIKNIKTKIDIQVQSESLEKEIRRNETVDEITIHLPEAEQFFKDQKRNADHIIHRAIQYRKLHLIPSLLYLGADINNTNGDPYSPLSRAIDELNNSKLIEKLLLYNPNLEVANYSNVTPLHLAILKNQVETTKLLLDKGANVHTKSNDGKTPLMAAATNGNLDIMKLLIGRGVDVNAADMDKSTALHSAIQHDRLGAVKMLLKFGIDVNAKSERQGTPLQLVRSAKGTQIYESRSANLKEMEALLIKHGAKE